MRPSNRTNILDAAVRVIERDGITALTFEAVATESGIARGGLLYHFPSRDALLQGIHQHLAGVWEASMIEAAGKPADAAETTERYQAYALTCAQTATRAELQLMFDAAATDENMQPWTAVVERWSPPTPQDLSDPGALDLFIAKLAADGMWVFEALSRSRLAPEVRQAIADRLARTIAAASKTA
ncbi:transcriptional regulator BetI [compost metagenome]